MGFNTMPELMTAKQICDMFSISYTTFHRELKSGRLKGFKVGDSWRFEKQAILNWIKKDEEISV
ncbi:transcriptional regulator, AlpA family [Sporobacter termitidis DSM 10068]|uniref:Transcriptional regulator, AlpA family n=1 Tax=Sporobacter termitidis DSM 10068 TaxID=1123282 RepID=A0A1M5ZCK0_9FIRM|nr:helix-turn-helix domain-containing protein [Sporobacter termitidis]SHI21930.1 transcriptional regulator, AlpA family [Sporobacter termitidis DSM 10068]